MKLRSILGGLAIVASMALPMTAIAEADDGQPFALVVDGVEYGISVDGSAEVKLGDGRLVEVTLVRRELATFARPFFSFEHKTELGVATSDLGNNVYQTLMTTPLGTLVLVQEYGRIDPSSLIDLMLNELTKEGIKAGGKLTKKSSVRELGNGGSMKGVSAQISTTVGSTTLYEVFAKSEGGGGVLVVTSIDQDNQAAEQEHLDRFWQSLDSHPPR